MFERMTIVPVSRLVAIGVRWFVVGLLAGAVLAWIAHARWRLAAAPQFRPIVIERQDRIETVARIPLRLGEREYQCTLRVDHRSRTWSLAC